MRGGHTGRAGGVQKKLAEAVAEEAAAHPGTPIEAWAFDEHRVGLKPVPRRVWAPKGQRPRAAGHHRFRWLYLYAFVEPQRGEVVWFLFNTVNVKAFEAALASFARTVGAGATRIVVLVLDNAGWHVPPDLAVPGGVRPVFLPPDTPELQPAERLWPLTNEPIANTSFATLADLDATLAVLLSARRSARHHLGTGRLPLVAQTTPYELMTGFGIS